MTSPLINENAAVDMKYDYNIRKMCPYSETG